MNKGNLSRIIEKGTKWRALDQTVAEARSKFSDMPPAELESLVDEAVAAVRRDSTPKAG